MKRSGENIIEKTRWQRQSWSKSKMLNAARWQISRWDQISPFWPLFCPFFPWYTLQSIDHPCSCADSRFILFFSAIQACWVTWPCDGAENERYFPPARQGRGQPIRWLTHWPAAFIGTLLPGRQEVASASHVVMIRVRDQWLVSISLTFTMYLLYRFYCILLHVFRFLPRTWGDYLNSFPSCEGNTRLPTELSLFLSAIWRSFLWEMPYQSWPNWRETWCDSMY